MARFNTETAAAAGRLNVSKRTKYSVSICLRQAIALQRVLYADATDPNTQSRLRAGLARAWCDVGERLRILRREPLPDTVERRKGRMTGGEPRPRRSRSLPAPRPAPMPDSVSASDADTVGKPTVE